MLRVTPPRIGVVVAVAASLVVWAAGPALADDPGGQQGVVWVPDTSRGGGGGVSTNSVPATGQFVCRAGTVMGSGDGLVWSTVQSFASGYATGNCFDGWHLHRTRREVNDNTWDGGYFYGDYAGCGWIRNDRDILVQDLPYTTCADPILSDASIAYVFDAPHSSGSGGHPCDQHWDVQ